MKLFRTTVAAAGVLLLLLALPPPPRPPRGEESLSRHGGDFRAADQSSGWMSAAAGDSSRILMKLTQIDHRGANQLTTDHSVRCERQDSLAEMHTALLRLSCPFSCTCLLLCSLVRTDSKIPEKSRPTLCSGTP